MNVRLLFMALLLAGSISVRTAIAQEATAKEAPVEPAAEGPAIYLKATETREIMAKEGQKVTVYGKTRGGGKSRTGTNFVNFEDSEFYLITFKTDLIEFLRGEPADYYNKKRIAVTGVVTVFKGKPQFKLTNPSQVEILKEDAEFPPKVDAAAKPEKDAGKNEAAASTAKEDPAVEKEPIEKPPVDPKKYFK